MIIMRKQRGIKNMMSLESIIAENDKTTQEARRKGLSPYIALQDGDEGIKKAPRFGYFVPNGYESVQEFFVDSTGWKRESEPALTFGQLLKKVREAYGYGIVECGQFQLYVREYKRV